MQNIVSKRSIVYKNSKKCVKIHKNHVITWVWNLQSQTKPNLWHHVFYTIWTSFCIIFWVHFNGGMCDRSMCHVLCENAKQCQICDIMCCTQYGHHFAPFFEYISMEGCVAGQPNKGKFMTCDLLKTYIWNLCHLSSAYF